MDTGLNFSRRASPERELMGSTYETVDSRETLVEAVN